MKPNFAQHPCFDPKARHTTARIHLPVAPRCNLQCHYCNRSHDCLHESRPGVTSGILTPQEALQYLATMLEKIPQTAVVGIAGPGDPLANPEQTLKTLELVRKNFPQLLTCLATNGLNLVPYLDELARFQVSHVTVTVNAVQASIGASLYAWMRYDKRTHSGEEAASYLWAQQKAGILGLKERGITVKVNTLYIPGYNDTHIEEVAKTVAELGADVFNLIPLYPVPGTPFGQLTEPDKSELARSRQQCAQWIPQMSHCQRCRADAAGLLGEDHPEIAATLKAVSDSKPSPRTTDCASCGSATSCSSTSSAPSVLTVTEIRPRRAAVGTMEGALVNLHLGQASEFAIYRESEAGWILEGLRTSPPTGGGDQRWKALAETLLDCDAVFVSGAGERPQQVLAEAGLSVWSVEGLIEDILDAWMENRLSVHYKTISHACGEGCRGSGVGCG